MNVRATSRRSVAATLVLLVLGAGSAVACTRNDPRKPAQTSGPASSSPTPGVDPAVADAEAQARAAYAGYIQTWAIASQAGDPDNPDLVRYVTDPLLGRVRHSLRVIKDKGAIQVGAQKATVISATVDLAAKPPTVTLKACLDYSALKLVYKSNQSPVPGSEITQPKVAAVVTVARYTTGQWLVNETKEGTDAC
jgi:hypothetical protein